MTAIVQTAFDRSVDMQEARQARNVAANRAECLADCESELASHRANIDQAQANVDGLEEQLEALDPDELDTLAVAELMLATSGGDAQAIARAAEKLQRLRVGLGPETAQRYALQARLAQCRADLRSARESLEKARNAALASRLAALDKDVERAVKSYEQAGQIAFDRYYLLVEVTKQHMKYTAALKNRGLADEFGRLQGARSEIELPALAGVPGHPIVRPVGRRIQQ